MEKDIEWAKKEIEKIYTLTFDAYEAAIIANNKHFEMKNSGQLALISKVLEIINQLDEPKTLSPEWIEEHCYGGYELEGTLDDDTETFVSSYDLQKLLVPKQELPVIPKFVAEWIEENHERNTMKELSYLNDSLSSQNMRKEHKLYLWIKENFDVFAGAWIAYPNVEVEVEKEQGYYAKAKGWEVFEKNSHHPYWNVLKSLGKDERLTISTFGSRESLTKDEWEILGINDDNADFVKVEELEE